MPTNIIQVNNLAAKNALKGMYETLVFMKLTDRQLDSQWTNNTNGYRQGDAYVINRAARTTTTAGALIGTFNATTGTWNTGNFIEDPIQFAISTNDQRNASASFTSKDKTLALSDMESRLGEPFGQQLAADTEIKVVNETITRGGSYIIATGGTVNGVAYKVAVPDLLKAKARLDALACPKMDRSTLIPADPMAQLSAANLSLFTPTTNEKIIADGQLNKFAGSTMFDYNLLPLMVVPTLVTPLALAANVVDGANTLTVTAVAGDNGKVLPAGTILEFASAEFVNPVTRVTIGSKYSVSLSAAVTLATGSNTLTFDAGAKIYSSTDAGARQNITALPLAGQNLTLVGQGKSYYQIVMFAKDAYTTTCIPLTTDLPGAYAQRADWNGFSIRTMIQTVVGSDTVVHRFDVIGKGVLQRDQYCVRVLVEKV